MSSDSFGRGSSCRWCIYALALLGCMALASCDSAPKRKNVLLLTLDTTRADALSFYDPARGRTPHLDALARQSLVFTNAITVGKGDS